MGHGAAGLFPGLGGERPALGLSGAGPFPPRGGQPPTPGGLLATSLDAARGSMGMPPIPAGPGWELASICRESGWIELARSSEFWWQCPVSLGSLIEIPTGDQRGCDGTALFQVEAMQPIDQRGLWVEARFLGASHERRVGDLDAAFPVGVGAPHAAALHLCRHGMGACTVDSGALGRRVLHVEHLRIRSLNSLTEPWVRRGLLRSPPSATTTGLPLGHGRPPDEPGDPDCDPAMLKKKVAVLKKKLQDQRAGASVGGRLALAATSRSGTRRPDAAPASDDDHCPSDTDPERDEGNRNDGASFRDALGRDRERLDIQQVARAQPGFLYDLGLTEMDRYISARSGASGTESAAQDSRQAVNFLLSIFHGTHPPEKVGVRNCRELRTLAEAIDGLTRGDLPAVGDLLMQRFKALTESVNDGSWSVARRLEVIPDTRVSLASLDERRSAAKSELLNSRLDDALAKAGGRAAKGTK